MRDVTIDEVFTWREEFGLKAKEAFGGWSCDVSPQTFSDLRVRCDVIERKENPFFNLLPVPLNGITVHVADGIPDGILRACNCKPQELR